jgi:hypothetical protein
MNLSPLVENLKIGEGKPKKRDSQTEYSRENAYA